MHDQRGWVTGPSCWHWGHRRALVPDPQCASQVASKQERLQQGRFPSLAHWTERSKASYLLNFGPKTFEL
jgi:hypothetical protein